MKDINTDNTYDTWLSKHGGYAKDMTLRDYFAAKAMVGLMSMQRSEEYVNDQGLQNDDETGTLFVHTEFFAKEAYMIADMMLKAREQ